MKIILTLTLSMGVLACSSKDDKVLYDNGLDIHVGFEIFYSLGEGLKVGESRRHTISPSYYVEVYKKILADNPKIGTKDAKKAAIEAVSDDLAEVVGKSKIVTKERL